jgi:energy-coupling factor transporter ATP-binding protein EcfA2
MIQSVSSTTLDRLPPHDEAAEQAIIGCVMSAPLECFAVVQTRFAGEKVFYNLTHETIWHTIQFLMLRDGVLDLITVQAELKSRGLLDQVGGIAYLSQCQDGVPSAANLPEYLEIVWEKFLARRLVQMNTDQVGAVYETGSLTESKIANIQQRHAEWVGLLGRGSVTPKNLSEPNQFGEAYYEQWFERKDDTFGFELPFAFPLRFRPAATTLMTGDNGSGKSSMLCLMSLIVAKQLADGEKVVVASMEMPPEVTLWIMARQLLGVGKLERTEGNIALIVKALAWLNKRVLLYNFLGITDKRDLMATFNYAAEHRAGKFFIIDNMMKVGIADDDYAEQGYFIQQVCDFDLKRKAHTIVVVHENKGDGSTKQKVRGSKQLTDAVDNVVKMQRNEAKAEKLEELKAELKAKTVSQDAYEEQLRRQKNVWDSKFLLSKQRWPGSQQNASKWLYFDHGSLQFHEEPNQAAFDYTA